MVPQVRSADIQSGIFSLLLKPLYSSEKDILDLEYHIFRYRIKQLHDHEVKQEQEMKKHQEDLKRR